MTIKKPMKASSTAETVVAPAAGGATIADRFKLDMPDPAAQKPATDKATVFAVIAAFAALALAGILTVVLFQHWEFLKGA